MLPGVIQGVGDVPLLWKRSLYTWFNCNSFAIEGIGEHSGNRNARQLTGYIGPGWREPFFAYVEFLKKYFHLITRMSNFDRNVDFKYSAVYWLHPRSIHLSSSTLIPVNVKGAFASHLSGPLFSLSLFQCIYVQFHLLLQLPPFSSSVPKFE